MKFSEHLFGDVVGPDFEKNARFIMERVLNCGRQSDWTQILNYYGLERIGREVVQIRWLEPRTRAFVSKFLKIPEDSFRSYQFQMEHPEIYFWNGLPDPQETDRSSVDFWPDYQQLLSSIDRLTSPTYPS